jgi:low temperature requirement protein LtrA
LIVDSLLLLYKSFSLIIYSLLFPLSHRLDPPKPKGAKFTSDAGSNNDWLLSPMWWTWAANTWAWPKYYLEAKIG